METSGGFMPLTADDRLAIHDLLATYWRTVDESDPEGFANTFTEDGVLTNYSGSTRGRAAIAEWLDGYMPVKEGNRHTSVNTLVTEVSDDEATVWSYMLVIGAYPPRVNTPYLSAIARFDDRVVRTAKGWRFAERVMTFG
jgi:uncharacterized protein (TIGR02246 family)